jgi:acyl carrier protein
LILSEKKFQLKLLNLIELKKEIVLLEKSQLKEFLIGTTNDDDITADEINDDTILVGENGIFFDSVDVLELIVELENKYGIKIEDNDLIKEKFRTFKTFYDFVSESKK